MRLRRYFADGSTDEFTLQEGASIDDAWLYASQFLEQTSLLSPENNCHGVNIIAPDKYIGIWFVHRDVVALGLERDWLKP